MSNASRELADKLIAELLADPGKREALEWLRSAPSGEVRTFGTLGTGARSIAFAEELYTAGATAVWAVEIASRVRPMVGGDERRENTGKLVVELPSEPKPRENVFRLERKIARSIGLDGATDQGQRHLLLMLD